MQPYLEASFRTRLQVRLDVTWVQVRYAHQKPRPGEGPQLTQTEAPLRVRNIKGDMLCFFFVFFLSCYIGI